MDMRRRHVWSLAALAACASYVHADEQRQSVDAALKATVPLVDVRLRYENVDQDGLPEDAEALTLRARLGLETGKAWNTSVLVEGNFMLPLQNDYRADPAVAHNVQYPVVADPENYAINRLQLTNSSLPQTTITLGRQRINLDDQRFVGNVGWRQTEQTYDALRVVNKSLKNLTLDVTWLNQVNRVFGKDSPQGRYSGDSLLANMGYRLPVGLLTGFGYLLSFDPMTAVPAAQDSSATWGLRFNGERALQNSVKLTYAASYAHQRERGANPLSFENDYYLAEFGAAYRQFNVGLGWEILDGDGRKGFATPLATLHKFQGWGDKFLATPVNGIDDRYASAGFVTKSAGPFDSLALLVSHHRFASQRLSQAYGSETDLQAQVKRHRFTGTLKFADYDASGFATDTSKLWLQVEYAR